MLDVNHLSIRADQRRNGMGAALLDFVLKRAQELDVHRVELDVWSLNQNAQSFFTKSGLETYNEKMFMTL